MKKGVIFDLDGTLINSLPDIAAAMNRSLAKFGLPGFEENSYKYRLLSHNDDKHLNSILQFLLFQFLFLTIT